MRLIDADAINPMRCPQSIAEMREWFDEIPTAYNTDKVVEQLIANSSIVEDGDGRARHFIFTEKAIEIVKKGGV